MSTFLALFDGLRPAALRLRPITAKAARLALCTLLAAGAALPASAEPAQHSVQGTQANALIALQMRARGQDLSATELLARAASSGDPLAQALLAQVWLHSAHAAQSAQAVVWLTQLCAGDGASADEPASEPAQAAPARTSACATLGRAWLRGTPTLPQARAKAQPLLERAASAGDSAAALDLGQLLHQASELGAPEPAAALERRQALGNRWLAQAARAGEVQAMFLLAGHLQMGHGAAADPQTALAWLRIAAGLEYPPAVQALAMAYQYGELGVAQNPAWAQRQLDALRHAITHPLPLGASGR